MHEAIRCTTGLYTMQPVVQPRATCIQTSSQLYKALYTRLHRVSIHSTSYTTICTMGCIMWTPFKAYIHTHTTPNICYVQTAGPE